jgi:hypothetical protein
VRPDARHALALPLDLDILPLHAATIPSQVPRRAIDLVRFESDVEQVTSQPLLVTREAILFTRDRPALNQHRISIIRDGKKSREIAGVRWRATEIPSKSIASR